MKFEEMLRRVRKKDKDWSPPHKLVALDPGKTVGWAEFINGRLHCVQEVYLGDEPKYALLIKQMELAKPDVVVCEDYKIYSWKAASHSWESLYTPQLIGAIRLYCEQAQLWLHLQMANTAKGFCKNKKLREWGYYEKGLKHGRDAIRHGCYWLLFNKQWKGGYNG